MAMNKKEQMEFNKIAHDNKILYALRWTNNKPVKPDVDIDSIPNDERTYNTVITGFNYNSYNLMINEAWTTCINHGHGEYNQKGSASQKSALLYSTKLLALEAMRYEVELQSAVKLAKIDKMIEDEQE